MTSKDTHVAFGVMGALMQPQGHLQIIMNLLDKNLNPQAALDAPRWQWLKDKEFSVEQAFSPQIKNYLLSRGHMMNTLEDNISFGRGQIIWKNPENIYAVGTEPRCDSTIACW